MVFGNWVFVIMNVEIFLLCRRFMNLLIFGYIMGFLINDKV